MTRPRILIAVFVLTGLLLAGSSFAQQAPGKAEKPSELSVFKASTIIGRQVVNVQGESLGKIEDLVLDPEEGRIRYAALSYGSILGLGGKLFAVAWENLEIHPDGQAFVLDLPTEALQHAPSFDKSNWPQQPNPVWRASVWRDEVVSGRIQEVNPDDATFSLTTETGNTVELQAPTELLVDLQAGDAVEVKIAGKQATKIHKKEGSPQPNTDDTQHTPQKPSDTRSRQPSTN